MIDIEAIRQRHEAAPGIIPHMPQDDGGAALCDLNDKDLGRLYPGPQMVAMARFVAHAGPDIAWLLGEVSRLTSALATAKNEERAAVAAFLRAEAAPITTPHVVAVALRRRADAIESNRHREKA